MKWIREADADIADALSSAKIAGMYLQRARGREARLFRSGSPSRRGCGVLVAVVVGGAGCAVVEWFWSCSFVGWSVW